MKRSDEQPGAHKLRRFLEDLRRRRSKDAMKMQPSLCNITFMPRMICCMEQTLYLNLPQGFSVTKNTRTECAFRHNSGLILNLTLSRTQLSLPRLREYDFGLVLTRRMIPSVMRRRSRILFHTFQHGFLRHSPTLYLQYALTDTVSGRSEDFVLYLLQWGERLYTVSFSGLNAHNRKLIDPICASISLKHHHEQTNIP